jgi:hypothetical protein
VVVVGVVLVLVGVIGVIVRRPSERLTQKLSIVRGVRGGKVGFDATSFWRRERYG